MKMIRKGDRKMLKRGEAVVLEVDGALYPAITVAWPPDGYDCSGCPLEKYSMHKCVLWIKNACVRATEEDIG